MAEHGGKIMANIMAASRKWHQWRRRQNPYIISASINASNNAMAWRRRNQRQKQHHGGGSGGAASAYSIWQQHGSYRQKAWQRHINMTTRSVAAAAKQHGALSNGRKHRSSGGAGSMWHVPAISINKLMPYQYNSSINVAATYIKRAGSKHQYQAAA